MSALPLSTQITWTSPGETEFRVNKVQYGNGYAQRLKDGINNVVSSWSVTWENISSTDYATLVAALDTACGVTPLTWTPPGESSKKWIVAKYSKKAAGGDYYTVSATLEQDFSI